MIANLKTEKFMQNPVDCGEEKNNVSLLTNCFNQQNRGPIMYRLLWNCSEYSY